LDNRRIFSKFSYVALYWKSVLLMLFKFYLHKIFFYWRLMLLTTSKLWRKYSTWFLCHLANI
jgi:hypothetical protein